MAKRLEGAKRLGGERLGGKRLGGETTRGRNGLGAKRPGFDKNDYFWVYGLGCCSLLTATLKDSRSGKHATSAGRAFHWTIASGKKEYL